MSNGGTPLTGSTERAATRRETTSWPLRSRISVHDGPRYVINSLAPPGAALAGNVESPAGVAPEPRIDAASGALCGPAVCGAAAGGVVACGVLGLGVAVSKGGGLGG